MPGVAVVTDSTNYLPRPITEHFAIREVSLYVTVNGVQHRETEMDSYDRFYRELADMRDLPTTSQPSIGDFLAAWEPLLAGGQDIVSVHLAGGSPAPPRRPGRLARCCASRASASASR